MTTKQHSTTPSVTDKYIPSEKNATCISNYILTFSSGPYEDTLAVTWNMSAKSKNIFQMSESQEKKAEKVSISVPIYFTLILMSFNI